MKSFQDKLCDAREKSKLSQQRLAEIIGVKQTTVSHWELGRFTPSKFMQSAVLAALKKEK